ncbi:ArsR family transcriptional regulator [[Brevibacterium] flavum]|uniref:ArsR family transcriptional regulator n=1 Tax=[Brevibacterium] flavum TaxID=92706 RepID=A0A0F6Z771_9CORY|nr:MULTISPECIES: helix-turn-helix domain-containing protein [Corynebacterium]AKF27906.1 ArsR family transcriptional regulator [[Brevibacterium] flavum]ANE08740.1 transcriptional regulator [Corynebacterium glutamicum]AST21151.1 transcriptional regulator [Corynebacterium glutamicum ATCC 14067]KEI23663.1 ArsR family transcriptional regulator [Corynebacterium glutamicum ATCC 14067]KIH73403.1 ArsR family transcriptional regulator [Corynebacterium glutamicum]
MNVQFESDMAVQPGNTMEATVTDIRDAKRKTTQLDSVTPFKKNCPSRTLLDTISDKWAVLILLSMENGPQRNGEIKDQVQGITPKMLTQRLGVLVEDGLVIRTSHAVVPPRVDYQLTDLGASVIEPCRAMYSWAVENIKQVEAYRSA